MASCSQFWGLCVTLLLWAPLLCLCTPLSTTRGVPGRGEELHLLGHRDSRVMDQRRSVMKRACNMATCITHRLADFLSRSGMIGQNSFLSTNVGAQGFGRRRRDFLAATGHVFLRQHS